MHNEIIEFDFWGWAARMGYDSKKAALALDISVGQWCKMKREGKARKLYAWAAYGIECAGKAEYVD